MPKINNLFQQLFSAMNELREEGVFTNKKDLTCQIGEWLVATLYDGTRSLNGIEKDWDIQVGGEHWQIKTHAKAPTTSARFTSISKNENAKINNLVIVIFTFDYKIKEFYKVPWKIAIPLIKIEKHKSVIYWNHLKEFMIEIEDLPKQEVVRYFL